MPRAVEIQKINVHYRDGRFLYGINEYQVRWPVTIQKLLCTTVVAGSCSTYEYQGGQLPCKNYCALQWWPIPVPMSTKVASYHPKITVHIPWWIGTAVNETSLKQAYRNEPWKIPGFFTGHNLTRGSDQ